MKDKETETMKYINFTFTAKVCTEIAEEDYDSVLPKEVCIEELHELLVDELDAQSVNITDFSWDYSK